MAAGGAWDSFRTAQLQHRSPERYQRLAGASGQRVLSAGPLEAAPLYRQHQCQHRLQTVLRSVLRELHFLSSYGPRDCSWAMQVHHRRHLRCRLVLFRRKFQLSIEPLNTTIGDTSQTYCAPILYLTVRRVRPFIGPKREPVRSASARSSPSLNSTSLARDGRKRTRRGQRWSCPGRLPLPQPDFAPCPMGCA